METRPSIMLAVVLAFYVTASTYAQDGFREGHCSMKNFNCDPNALCTQSTDGTQYKCYCPSGFSGDGFHKDIGGGGCAPSDGTKTCLDDYDCADYGAYCKSTDETFDGVCVCNDGYTWGASVCEDVNECLMNLCGPNTVCTNQIGNYTCSCDTARNFYRNAAGNCVWRCFTAQDCGSNSDCQKDGTCKCRSGYSSAAGNGRDCADINECATGQVTCPNGASCVNTEGSYTCQCAPGFFFTTDKTQCLAYPKSCNEVYTTTVRMQSGTYSIDVDGPGPKAAFQVYCEVRSGFAITVIGPRDASPQRSPKRGETETINYGGVNPKDLLDASPFCSQEIWVSCTNDLKSLLTWKDQDDVSYTGWPSPTNLCPCGQMRKCTTCNCGAGKTAVDQGLVLNAAVKSVTFPVSTNYPGTYMIGPLRCGPKPFDIPKDCHQAKFEGPWRLKENRAMNIDPDGPDGPRKPFMVFCDMEKYSHVGVTQIPLDTLAIKSTTNVGQTVKYLVPGDDRQALIDGSLFCSQKLEYQCETSTMTQAGARVLSQSNDTILDISQPGKECDCYKTASCTKGLRCNCESGTKGKDIKLIIDKSKLPVINVRSNVADNTFVFSPLECSQNQFGIQPNCEKYRQEGFNDSYAYPVDPDGPGQGNNAPFLAECKIEQYQGITIVHNDNGKDFTAASGTTYTLTYPNANTNQVSTLKDRSTYCTQDVSLTCTAAVDASQINVEVLGGNSFSLSDVLNSSTCRSGGSKDIGRIVLKGQSPISIVRNNGVNSAKITVGPLVCKEIFANCNDYQNFVGTSGVLGENKLDKALLTIDPDGAGSGDPIVVRCNWAETVINAPIPLNGNRKTLKRTIWQTGTQCWPISYTDDAGNSVGAGQLAALVEGGGKSCRQDLTISCGGAGVGGGVTYKTCGGKVMTNLVGDISGKVTPTCACGVSGVCKGGPSQECNCNSPSSILAPLSDYSVIMEKQAIPICEICLTIDGPKAATSTGIGASEISLTYNVGRLVCGKKGGRFPNCQMYRRESAFLGNVTTLVDMWFDSNGEPFIVGCIFTPDPPTGELIVRPITYEYDVPEDGTNPLNVTVTYRGIDIFRLKEMTSTSNYCSQNIYFFCADQMPALTGAYGFYHADQKITSAQLRQLSAAETTALCSKPAFTDRCNRCPGKVLGLSVQDKNVTPVSKIVLPPTAGKIKVYLDDATCGNIEKDCDAILKAGRDKEILETGHYIVDPDQAGPLRPFKVECEFIKGVGVTKVPIEPKWSDGTLGATSNDNGFPFSFAAKYPTATIEQISSLSVNSRFCWQGVKFTCQGTGLAGSGDTTLELNGARVKSFGTGDITAYTGCACGVLGTCDTQGLKCNCDAKGPMTSDRGFITDLAALPLTGINFNVRPSGSGVVKVGGVRCSPAPVDHPQSCLEAYQWGQSYGTLNGVDYTVSGVYLVSPEGVTPFLVYCDFTSRPGNPTTILKPTPTNDRPVTNPEETVDYNGLTDDQLKSLVKVSGDCYQPVRVDCYAASFIGGGANFSGSSLVSSAGFNSLGQPMCSCGTEQKCGGSVSYTQQKAAKCNCDLGDRLRRRDVAILKVKTDLPFRRLRVRVPADGQLNMTVGNLVCTKDPVSINECAENLHDCAEEAVCVDTPAGYECDCPTGWEGKTAKKGEDDPIANGRQCIDDDECASVGVCPYNADCVNTPGSYYCQCHKGFRNNSPFTCVDIDECKEPGSHIPCDPNARCVNTEGSYRCFCNRGFRGDGYKCYPVQKCTCFGDPHCLSFDGKWNHHQGQCSYTMVKSNCNGSNNTLPTFTIKNKNWNRGFNYQDYAWVKDVIIEVYGQVIEIKQGRSLYVNGEKRNYFKLLSADKKTLLLLVTKNGLRVELFTNFGLEVSADGIDQVSVYAPHSLKGNTCGLCGNFDTSPANDWIVGPACPADAGKVTDNETKFGNSWADTKECAVDCNASPPPPRCTSMPTAESKCNLIFQNASSPFNRCLNKMDASMRAELKYSCTFDLCRVPAVDAALCEFAEAMAEMCEEVLAGESITWRNLYCKDQPVQCDANMVYKECGPTVELACNTQDMVPEDQCVFNCYCMDGYMREQGDCIPKEDCGCYYMDQKLQIGQVTLSPDCSEKVTCTGHNVTEEMPSGFVMYGSGSCGPPTTTVVTTTTAAPTTTTQAPPPSPPPTPPPPTTTTPETNTITTTTTISTTTTAPPPPPTTTPTITDTTAPPPPPTTTHTITVTPTYPHYTPTHITTDEPIIDTTIPPSTTTNITDTTAPPRTTTTPIITPPPPTTTTTAAPPPTPTPPPPPPPPGGDCEDVKLRFFYDDNVLNVEQLDNAEQIIPNVPDLPFKATYVVADGDHATFVSVKFMLINGDAKVVRVFAVGDNPGDLLEVVSQTNVVRDEEITLRFATRPKGKRLRFVVEPSAGYPVLAILETNMCLDESPKEPPPVSEVTECAEAPENPPALGAFFTDNVRQVETRADGDFVHPRYNDRFMVVYRRLDRLTATFRSVTFRLSRSAAKVSVWVINDSGTKKEVQTEPVKDVAGNQDVTVSFPDMPVGTKLRIVVFPEDEQTAPTLQVVKIEVCDEAPEKPSGDKVTTCMEPGKINPAMYIRHTSNVHHVDRTGSRVSDVVVAKNKREKFVIAYAAEDYNTATFASTEFVLLNHGADRVTIWIVGTDKNKVDIQTLKKVSANTPVRVNFPSMPVGKKIRFAVIPNANELVPDLRINEIEVCVQPKPVVSPMCEGVVCDEPNTECDDGVCVCSMGYTVDCERCVDVNECETGEHTCVHLGQACVNTEGSFKCECKDGYKEKDGYCHDVNECEEVPGRCGTHSQCTNMLGTYDCPCCMGYVRNGAECQRVPGTPLYGGPGEECCACSGDSCSSTEPVCATDGQSYPNYKAMVEAGCRKNVTLHVSYKGACEDDCGRVQCEGLKVCTNSGPGGVGQCVCEGCRGGSESESDSEVCASNGKIYPSECFFNLVRCETGREELSLSQDMEPCGGGSGSPPVSQWTPWSQCSESCGVGFKKRTRNALRRSDFHLQESVPCYTTCPDGPCPPEACPNPGQVCDGGNCMCPDCKGWQSDPVCGLVGDVIKTYDNECQMQKQACELTKNFRKLEDGACEDKPRDCGRIRYFARLVDENGCTSDGYQDIGLCYGGCQNMGECCRPDPQAERVSVDLNYKCPNGSSYSKQEQSIQTCSCINEPQH